MATMYMRVLQPSGLDRKLQSKVSNWRPMYQLHRFADRESAGRELARAVRHAQISGDVLVLGLPRGGVPVANEVAHALQAPLDVLIVRKIGAPFQPELAIGAIASGNIVVRDPQAASLDVSEATFQQLLERERSELQRREHAYRHGRGPLVLQDKVIILVDDGLATGTTMLAAVRATRAGGASSVIVAAPVASSEAMALLRPEADRLIVLRVPPYFYAVGEWYQRFDQTSDEEVKALLADNPPQRPRGAAGAAE